MSELDVFGFIGMNRSIFATLFLCGVLMPLAVVIIAYLFRNFSTVIRGGAMVSANGIKTPHKNNVAKIDRFMPIKPNTSSSDIFFPPGFFYL